MKRIPLILILATMAVGAADTTSTSASRDAHRARMSQAVEARDYDAWKAERDAWGSNGQAGQKVTRENFETFAKLHEAVKAGRTEEAASLRRELGLVQGSGNGPRGQGMGQGAGCGKGQGRGDGQGQGQGKGRNGQRGNGGQGGAGCKRNG